MPRVKIDYIVSFSSEDPDNQANNLLSSEVNKRRWLCCAGETSCSVVLQLERSVQISAVHVGAHHAALVEVLVGRSETPNEPFQVLVPSCVFVSPAESRRPPVDRVRSFSAAQLSAVAARRWDRLRIVCSQPYNKHCKYGLSFVHVYSPEEPRGAPPSPPVPVTVPVPGDGRRSSSEEESYQPGQLFARARATVDTGAQIRQATAQVLKNISDSSTKLVKTPISKQKTKQATDGDEATTSDRRRDSLVYTADDERPHHKIDRVMETHHRDKHTREHGDKRNTEHKQKTDDNNTKQDDKPVERRSDDRRDHSRHNKRPDKKTTPPDDEDDDKHVGTKRETAKKRARSTDKQDNDELRPGPVSAAPHQLLADVVVVLSGYQNPLRSQLRTTALALGARVQPAWNREATHLVCAFPNTPKLREARALSGGRVRAARGEWLQQMAAHRRRLPWQWFATDRTDGVPAPQGWQHAPCADDNDTDDEIEKVIQEQKRARRDSSGPGSERHAAEDGDSDDSGATRRLEESDTELEDAAPLVDMFADRTFVVEAGAGEHVPRYILAYGGLVLQGSVEDNEHVDYVVIAGGRGRGRGLHVGGGGGAPHIVDARWLWRCHRAQKILPPGGTGGGGGENTRTVEGDC